jgi:hypothetical protein
MRKRIIKNSPTLEWFLSQRKTLVAYVRDILGYRKGVVVALGKNQIGYSLVNLSEDVLWTRVKPHQLPAIQKMIQGKMSYDEIVKTAPYQRCINENHMTRIPKFEKRIGLLIALDSCLRSEVEWMATGLDEPMIMSDVPNDADLKREIIKMIDRAGRYYKEEL